MVTASDGSPTYATRKPLSRPQSTPTTRATRPAIGIERPCWCSSPTSTLLRPTTLATERSISPVTITSVIGSAMSRIGATSRSRNGRVSGPEKLATLTLDQATTTTSSPMTPISRVSRVRRHSGCAWSG
jgi:hypothetical protein